MRGIAGSGASIMSLRVGSFMRIAPWLAVNCSQGRRVEHESEPPFSSQLVLNLVGSVNLHIKLTKEVAIEVALRCPVKP